MIRVEVEDGRVIIAVTRGVSLRDEVTAKLTCADIEIVASEGQSQPKERDPPRTGAPPQGGSTGNGPAADQASRVPFSGKKREMVIHEDRITICGMEVWKDCGQPDLREALALLSKTDENGFVRIRGAKLNAKLNRNASNPIGRPIKSFRDRAAEVLRERGLDCGPQDIIASGRGGYHLAGWMVVKVAGSRADEPIEPVDEPAREPDEPAAEDRLNDRQRWVWGEIERGTELRQKDVIAHFRRWNPSTIKRDLKGLRDMGLIKTHADGYYVRVKGQRERQP